LAFQAMLWASRTTLRQTWEGEAPAEPTAKMHSSSFNGKPKATAMVGNTVAFSLPLNKALFVIH